MSTPLRFIPPVYLASQSPRRRELLDQIGVRHSTLSVEVDETPLPGEDPETYVRRLALEKARAGHASLPGGERGVVIGADTAVVVDDRILGKPSDRDDALAMLALLSAREHLVLTAVAVVGDSESIEISRSRVRFRPLRPGEADAYWDTGEPADKAGAYAVQGLGALFIAHLDGSYSGVMGLPLFQTAELLRAQGVELLTPC